MTQAKRIQLHNKPLEPLRHALESEGKAFVLDVEQAIKTAFDADVESGMALLFQYYYTVLCSHAVRFVQSKAVAEDIVSDIFYEFHVHQRHQYIMSSFRAFLFTAVRNRSFDYIKTEMKRSTSLDDARMIFTPTHQLPDAITQYEELYNDFQDAINAMPLKRRQIYLMHRFEGKKYHDIAEELDLSTRTIEAHLYQANRQIRELLQDKWLTMLIAVSVFWS